MKITRGVCTVLVAAGMFSCWAANWIAADGEYPVEANWNNSVKPSATDRAYMGDGGIMRIPATVSETMPRFCVARGTVYMQGGEIRMTQTQYPLYFGDYGHAGALYMESGTFAAEGPFYGAWGGDCAVYQTGGLLSMKGTSYISVSDGVDCSCRYECSGGEFRQAGKQVVLCPNNRGTAELVLQGEGLFDLAGTTDGLRFGAGTARMHVYLKTGGTLVTPLVKSSDVNGSSFVFDGGVIRVAVDSASASDFLQGTGYRVASGGLIFDTNGQDATCTPDFAADGDCGGFEKRGLGVLTMSGDLSCMTGTTVRAGKYVAATPAQLPGWNTGCVRIESGAVLKVGGAWKPEEWQLLLETATVLPGGSLELDASYDTTDGDIVVSSDMKLSVPLKKYGPGTLTLSGRNEFSESPQVFGGTLCADFGVGLDSSVGVFLTNACLAAHATPLISATLGSGAGQILFAKSPAKAGFTAKGIDTTVNLGGDGRTLVYGTDEFSPASLVLNSSEADHRLTFANDLDVNGADRSVRVDVNVVEMTGKVVDSQAGNTHLRKAGAGTLVLSGADNTVPYSTVNGQECGTLMLTNGYSLSAATSAPVLTGRATVDVHEGVNVVVTAEEVYSIGYNGGSDVLCRQFGGYLGYEGGNLKIGYAGTGELRMFGGETYCRNITSLAATEEAIGYLDVRGGVFTKTDPSGALVLGEGASTYARLNLSGTGKVCIDRRCKGLSVASGANAVGEAYLCRGGRLETPRVYGNANGAVRKFAFAGGTLAANGGDYLGDFVSGLTTFTVGARGGAVDTDGHDVTINQPLLAADDDAAPQGLAHRWSFNGSLADSVGGSDAVATGASPDAETITLAGGAHGTHYVDLGSGVFPTTGDFTVEIWGRADALRKWTRIFNTSDGGVDVAWTEGDDDAGTDSHYLFGLRQKSLLRPIWPGEWYHFAWVFRRQQDGTYGISLYKTDCRKGELMASATMSPSAVPDLVQLNAASMRLGYSNSELNDDAPCTFDEVRVWHAALSEKQILRNAKEGPDATFVTASFAKKGVGRLTLAGENSYTCGTRLETGTLAFSNSAGMPENGVVEIPATTLASLTKDSEVLLTAEIFRASKIVIADVDAVELTSLRRMRKVATFTQPLASVPAIECRLLDGTVKPAVEDGWVVQLGGDGRSLLVGCPRGFALIVR